MKYNQWYEIINLEKFKTKYPPKQHINVDEILKQHNEWATQVNIKYTPTVFVNGYLIIKPYFAKYLPDYIGSLEDVFPPAIQ